MKLIKKIKIKFFYKNSKSLFYLKRAKKIIHRDLISVIIPTFNRATVIGRAIESVLNQNYQNFEILIVDDGSTDNTQEKLQEFLKDNRIRFFKIEKRGVSYARNHALQNSCGDYITFLDSDDMWHPMFLSIMVSQLQQNPGYKVAYAGVLFKNTFKNKEIVKSRPFDRSQLLEANYIPMIVLFFTREVYENTGGFNDNMTRLVDWELILRIASVYKFLHIDMVLATAYIEKKLNNITSSEDVEKNMVYINETIKKYHGS